MTIEDCLDILKDMHECTTFSFNRRDRRSDNVTNYHVYKTDKKLSAVAKEDNSFFVKDNYELITAYGENVTRDLERKLKQGNYQKIERPIQIKAFLSASFSDEIDDLISWFIQMINSMGIDVIWLKEKFQVRPPEQKIKENIWLCNCFIQIITRDVANRGKEAGWLGNEIAWARESPINGNMAIFVEKGVEASGLARIVTDNLSFQRDNLQASAPKIAQYLNDLKEQVLAPH